MLKFKTETTILTFQTLIRLDPDVQSPVSKCLFLPLRARGSAPGASDLSVYALYTLPVLVLGSMGVLSTHIDLRIRECTSMLHKMYQCSTVGVIGP